jgi:hypothetical protein
VFIGTAWTWEGWGRKVGQWIRNNVAPIPEAISDVSKRAAGPEDGPSDTEQKQ